MFIDNEIDIDWKTTDKYDEKGPRDVNRQNEILNRVAMIECIPNDHHGNAIRLNFKRMIGEGVARSLDHDYDNASKMLDKAEKYISERNIETARLWQLEGSTLGGLVCAIFGLLLWFLRFSALQSWGETAFFAILASCAGGIGANLSFIFRIGKTHITSEAIRRLHIIEALCRVLGGGICGLAIALLVQLGILVPVFKNIDKTYLAMVVAGLAAGSSERWVPSLIAKIEDSSIKGKEKLP